MADEHDLRGMRLAYDRGTLIEADLAPDPLAQFRRWLADAVADILGLGGGNGSGPRRAFKSIHESPGTMIR